MGAGLAMLKPARPRVDDEFAALRAADGAALRALGGKFAAGAKSGRRLLAQGAAWLRASWHAFAADARPVWDGARRDLGVARRGVATGLTSLALAAGALSVAAPGGLMLAAGVALVRPAPAPPPAEPEPQEEVLPDYVRFIERFRSIDPERWIVSDGWHNGEWSENDWRASALHPGPNGLRILMSPNEPGAEKPLASGELQSQEMFRYGYFEVRMRVPRGSGTGVGFFTFTRPGGRETWQEIDVEFVGRNTRDVELTYHRAGRSRSLRLTLPFDAADDFHTYAFEWTPEGVRWYIDNQLAHEEIGRGAELLNAPQRLYLMLFASRIEVWAGRMDYTRGPWMLDVTCVAQAQEYRGVSLCAP